MGGKRQALREFHGPSIYLHTKLANPQNRYSNKARYSSSHKSTCHMEPCPNLLFICCWSGISSSIFMPKEALRYQISVASYRCY